MANSKRSAFNRLSTNHFLQRVAKRIASQNANHDWILGCPKRPGGPFHEFREVIKEGRLHLVFVDLLAARSTREQHPQEDHCGELKSHGNQKRQVTLANTLRSTSVRFNESVSKNSACRGDKRFCPTTLNSTNSPTRQPKRLSNRA